MRFAVLIRLICVLLAGLIVLPPAEAFGRERKRLSSSRSGKSSAKKNRSGKPKRGSSSRGSGRKRGNGHGKRKSGRSRESSAPARALSRSNELPMTVAEREKARRR